MSHQVIDDFLPETEFTTLQNFLMETGIYTTMPYTYRENWQDSIDDFSLQANLKNFPSIADPLLDQYKAQEVYICRANVIMRREHNHIGGFHTDFIDRPDITTSVLYINDCNGGTAFEDGEFVESRANRAVIFNNTVAHAGVWQTDTSFRYVVNTNFVGLESFREKFWSPL